MGEVIDGWLAEQGRDSIELVVVNSCTVTDEADRQSRKAARKLARRHDGATVVMTGCGAEVAPEAMAQAEGGDLVVGNQNKPDLVARVLAAVDAEERGILGSVQDYGQSNGKLKAKHPEDRPWPEPDVRA